MKLKIFSNYNFVVFLGLTFLTAMQSCKDGQEKESIAKIEKSAARNSLLIKQPDSIKVPEGMVWVSGVHFTMGAQDDDKQALPREKPAHPVAVDGFFIDKTEVTNAEFKKFVNATGYVTLAEKPIKWEEMKTQLPPGTPRPADSILQPGSLIFNKELQHVYNLNDYSQWWEWKHGADWRHPEGPGTSIKGKDDYPVVHIAYKDALAYCEWANRRLPSEAQWEAAAHGKLNGGIYTWGNDPQKLDKEANTWQGEFPIKNLASDGYTGAAPAASFSANSLGIYDMAGNVWEWTQDWFDVNYYSKAVGKGELRDPKGAEKSYNPQSPYQKEKVIKGGSFLCAASYCASYRISARMGNTMDSATDHTGFRTVATVEMLSE
ncbi:MAG TPA: formylglycine-generating enzyme family protein [Leeuwenhoekiella sp.]|nr:formylglycine-generating enzyme family protein [Leeuwenhoekiella sp.]